MKHPVLYIHGANSTPDSFTYLMSGMPEGHQFDYVFYDAQRDTLADIVEQIEDYISENHDGVHLVGHSLGGVLAVNAALGQCDEVLSVTTLASPFGGVELPFALRMFHWFNRFVQNLEPRNEVYLKSRQKLDCPLQVLKTVGGNNPLLLQPNDGTITVASQHHPYADQMWETPWNHFEILLHPSIREQIIKFIDEVEADLYK